MTGWDYGDAQPASFELFRSHNWLVKSFLKSFGIERHAFGNPHPLHTVPLYGRPRVLCSVDEIALHRTTDRPLAECWQFADHAPFDSPPSPQIQVTRSQFQNHLGSIEGGVEAGPGRVRVGGRVGLVHLRRQPADPVLDVMVPWSRNEDSQVQSVLRANADLLKDLQEVIGDPYEGLRDFVQPYLPGTSSGWEVWVEPDQLDLAEGEEAEVSIYAVIGDGPGITIALRQRILTIPKTSCIRIPLSSVVSATKSRCTTSTILIQLLAAWLT